MRIGDMMNQSSGVEIGAMVGVRGTSASTNNGPNGFSSMMPATPFDLNMYSRLMQQITKIYSPFDHQAMAALPLALTPTALPSPQTMPNVTITSAEITKCAPTSPLTPMSVPVITPRKLSKLNNDEFSSAKKSNKTLMKTENDEEHALDLSTQGLRSLYSSYQRISLDQVRNKVVEDLWVENDTVLSWKDSRVAAYNPAQKLFMCVDCECVGFLSRVAEHWLGAHANLRVFHCPRCPYTSAWSRCVKMHLTRQHNEQFADTTMWKENATLMEVTKLMQDLRTKVETRIDSTSALADKRFYCPHCPYATDRRDLYTRHENIHKDNKPFHCYMCFKQFNRADHVKKHFVRMHPDTFYDISKIRKQPTANSNRSNNASINNKPVNTPETKEPGIINSVSGVSISPMALSNDIPPLATLPNKVTPNIRPSPQTPVPALAVAALAPPPNIQPIPGEGSPASPIAVMTSGTESPEPGTPRGRRRGGSDRAFTCPYCHWSGTDNWCLKRHMNTHIKPFACTLCDYKAARAERLSTHVWKVHNKRICSKCSFLADTQDRLLEHTREEHHNNPYSRRFICNTCGLSFDTRPSLETHLHLAHTRVAIPETQTTLFNVKTPLIEKHFDQDAAQDLTIKREPQDSPRPNSQLVCPVVECKESFKIPVALADHVRRDHIGEGASKCPHCGYALKNEELSKDHWLTHHKDVCPACVQVFTAVYGPQLWKKVHVKIHPSESPLDAIVSGLNRKRSAGSDYPIVQDVPSPNVTFHNILSLQSAPESPILDNREFDSERCSKRSRKQSCPKKVILVDEDNKEEDEKEEISKNILCENSSNENIKQNCQKPLKRRLKSGVLGCSLRHCCLKCSNRPVFSSRVRLQMHKKWRHRKSKSLKNKNN